MLIALVVGGLSGLGTVSAQSGVDYDADDETALNKTQALNFRVCVVDGNWDSEITQNRLLRSIMSLGYGYALGKCPTRNTSSSSLVDEISDSSDMVVMEFWLGNVGPGTKESWTEAIQRGKLYSPGSSMRPNWQSAFVIPKYLQEQYPKLDSVEDLKHDKYRSLFATSATRGKAHLVSCPVGWLCEQANAEQVKGYGLSDHIEIVNPEGQAEMLADLEGAYNRREPWLGYTWASSDSNLLLDLVRLKELRTATSAGRRTRLAPMRTPQFKLQLATVFRKQRQTLWMCSENGILTLIGFISLFFAAKRRGPEATL